jgi:hypothetical protein
VKPSNSLAVLASIIIPCCDPLEVTRRCIIALGRHTRQPWDLIVVDDGSTDETSAYLASVRDAVPVPVTVIASATRRGIAAAINQGLRTGRGEYLVLLTPPSMRPEVCPARTEPRPPDTGRPPEQRPAAYVVRCACAPGLDGTKGGTVVDHVRLFPLRPGVRWTYWVHEQILPSLKRAKIPARWTDLVVHHKGYAALAVEARKLVLLPWSKLAAPLFHSLRNAGRRRRQAGNDRGPMHELQERVHSESTRATVPPTSPGRPSPR